MIAAGPSAPDARFWRALSHSVTYPRPASIPPPSRFAFRHRFRRGSPVGCGFRRGVFLLFVFFDAQARRGHKTCTRHRCDSGSIGSGQYPRGTSSGRIWRRRRGRVSPLSACSFGLASVSKQPRLASSASSDWSPGLPTVLPGLAHVSSGTSAAPHARQHVPKAHHSTRPSCVQAVDADQVDLWPHCGGLYIKHIRITSRGTRSE